jgi:hypothetical protein
MQRKWRKIGFVALAVLLLGSAGLVQRGLNTQRANLGLTRIAPLESAPPVLAFTTVALGGFRGLIANALWIRANKLQEDGQYFEMVQLADWITKLEPTFAQVWIVQAWNMAYNISVKFPAPEDRWRWVLRGIELLRDGGLRYNPKEALIYRELAWFFQHKIGMNLDDGHLYYKYNWAVAMTNLFGGSKPNYQELLNPSTPAQQTRAERLRNEYKMDPLAMQEIDRLYGPLDWRLPEAHSIYWGHIGLKHSNKKDLITLRRVVYQSMALSVLRGRLVSFNPLWLGPNLDAAERANEAYEQMIAEETESKHVIQNAHKSFLGELTYLSYSYGRTTQAQRWFTLMKEKYPDAVPAQLSLEAFSLQRIVGNYEQLGHDRAKALLEGILAQHWIAVALADDDPAQQDRAVALANHAAYLWNYYMREMASRRNVLALPPLNEMTKAVLDLLLQSDETPPEIRARLRARAGVVAPSAEQKTPATPGPPAKTP